MFNRNKAILSLALTGLLVLTVPAGAETLAESGIASEVESCIAEVRERLDYSDAVSVRHYVTAVERRIVGYTMKISTSVYGDAEGEAIRVYAATCVVNGDNQPLRFRFSEDG